MRYIPLLSIIGSLGNHYPLEQYIKFEKYIENNVNKPVILLQKYYKLRNSYLFSYFKPHINVISNRFLISKYQVLGALFTLPLKIVVPLKNNCFLWDIATNLINQKLILKNNLNASFIFNKSDLPLGKEILSRLGVPKNAWYVTLHVRQPGYRDEDSIIEDYRNADPLTYIKAIKLIVNKGGWVIIVGDKSMKIMPKMHGLIDYAHSKEKSEFMDIFLAATCKFCIGTSSGFYAISMMFGIPVLVTNFLPAITYYSLTSQDMFLPKILINNKNNHKLTLKEMFDPPVSFYSGAPLTENNVDYINNSEEDLEKATSEMIEMTLNKSQVNQNIYHQKFKEIAEINGKKHGGCEVKAFANISLNFLKKNSFLFNDERDLQ